MSHDRGVATKAETHRAARWQGAGRGGRGAEPPSMVKARCHRSTGLRPPALRMSSSTPLSLTPLPTPRPASRRPLAWAWAGGQAAQSGRRPPARPARWAQPPPARPAYGPGHRWGPHRRPRGASACLRYRCPASGHGRALAVESRALVTVVRRKRAGLT